MHLDCDAQSRILIHGKHDVKGWERYDFGWRGGGIQQKHIDQYFGQKSYLRMTDKLRW